MKAIALFVLNSVMKFGLAQFQAWWNRRQAEAARHKAQQLEAFMKGKEAAKREEAEYVEADRKLQLEQDKVKKYEDKLAKLTEMYS